MRAVIACALLPLVGCGLEPEPTSDEVEAVVAAAVDVTGELERLGNPSKSRWPSGEAIYARNPWDLLAWQGRLHIGQGNSSNQGPAPNAGPADILTFDPATGAFSTAVRTQDEQVDRFLVQDRTLVVPGHDATGSWAAGNHYVLGSAGWQLQRVHPDAVHVYDLQFFRDEWYAAIGATDLATVQKSARLDGGWRDITTPPFAERGYNLFALDGDLFLSSKHGIYRRVDLLVGEVFAPASTSLLQGGGSWVGTATPPVIVREQRVGQALVYIVARNVNDHQWEPIQLDVAHSPSDVTRAAIPRSEAPWDILVRPDATYALTSRPIAAGFASTVWRSVDLGTWTPIVTFRAPTFARSFELIGSDFYFGLGCNTSPRPDATGDILRVDAAPYL